MEQDGMGVNQWENILCFRAFGTFSNFLWFILRAWEKWMNVGTNSQVWPYFVFDCFPYNILIVQRTSWNSLLTDRRSNRRTYMDIYTVSITAKNTQINLKDFEIINNFPPYFNATVLVYPMKTLSLEVICRYSTCE